MFARGLLRERLLADRAPRVLMAANSGVWRKLVLCETISCVTASEFKNLGVQVEEFYGRSAGSPEILDAARNANLILYEGHLSTQDLIDNPELRRSSPPEYADDEDEDSTPNEPQNDQLPRPAPAPRVVLAEPGAVPAPAGAFDGAADRLSAKAPNWPTTALSGGWTSWAAWP